MLDQFALTEFEKIIARSKLPGSQSSIFAGTSRLVRMSFEKRQPYEEVVCRLSSGLIAPLCFLFVWWVLWTAQKNRIRRLYFLSRDGQVFFKAAKILIDAWGLDIEACYLYCSRESLLVPSFQEVTAFEENWITWAYQGEITFAEICARLNVYPEDLGLWLSRINLKKYEMGSARIIPPSDLKILIDSLKKDEFCEVVREATRPRFETTLNYLVQEGLGEEVPFAVVDTGWTGSSQYALNNILKKGGYLNKHNLTGYYLGVNRGAYSHSGDLLDGFLFDWRYSHRDQRLYNFICFELLFSGLHGRTTSYREFENKFEPVFEGGLSGFPLEASKIHHGFVEEYTRQVANLISFDAIDIEASSQLGRSLMLEFICSPSTAIASTYGNWPMASEIRENDSQNIAPPMDLGLFFRYALAREKVKGYWPQASLIRGRQYGINRLYNLFLGSGALEFYRKHLLRY